MKYDEGKLLQVISKYGYFKYEEIKDGINFFNSTKTYPTLLI